MLRTIHRYIQTKSGATLVEFAIALPVLLLLIYGAVELNRYITILQKLDKTAYTIADIVTRVPGSPDSTPENNELSIGLITNEAFNNFDNLMRPYSQPGNGIGSNGVIAITSVYKDDVSGSDPLVMWQIAGGGTLSNASTVSEVTGAQVTSSPSTRCTLPSFSSRIEDALNQTGGMRDRENMIAVEVFYEYEPLFGTEFFSLARTTLSRSAFFTPRTPGAPPVNLPPDFCCYDYTQPLTTCN